MSNPTFLVDVFSEGKEPPKNEDKFAYNQKSIVLSDGATDKTGIYYEKDKTTGNYRTGGDVAASIAVETALSSGLNGIELATAITNAMQFYYQQHCPQALDDPAYRFAATLVAARIQNDKLVITQIGDSSFRINGRKEYKNDKEIDQINSDLRKEYVNRTGDIPGGRTTILDSLKEQYKLQNNSVDKLGYGALDGSEVPEKFVKVFEFPLTDVGTVEIVSDGYYGAFPPEPTIEAYEELHRQIEEVDPHKVGQFASTKTSDDRTVLIANIKTE